ncbi:DMT family transporter [Planomicrobium okeanokoites]|uniref:DMT family transporter n=1 Tax=Planomicrobium okeanokoites TaxID=244 RepID=A0ABV7KT60_PLAOK|nr:EamA family transporter [Planomicrobium okeanokoites]TAA70199.1 EamA/RhaT family transporter [Planomicrobium okeanokoites]
MNRVKGIAMILSGAALWGATGPLMEWLFEAYGISVSFLLTLRLIIAGVLLLVFLKLKRVKILSVFHGGIWVRQLLIFSVLGMLGVQFSFVSSIETSNAVVATLFQFLAPVYLILFISLRHKKFPPKYQVIGMIGTMAGLFLLLTNGRLDELAISGIALFWGVMVGLAFAFYTLYPGRLMEEWGVLLIVGWSMLFGGIFLGLVNPVFRSADWPLLAKPGVSLGILAVIIIGTLAFVLFLSSMRFILPVEASILSAFEPLTAMIISALWFGQFLEPIQLGGAAIMLVFVTWLSLAGDGESKELAEE